MTRAVYRSSAPRVLAAWRNGFLDLADQQARADLYALRLDPDRLRRVLFSPIFGNAIGLSHEPGWPVLAGWTLHASGNLVPDDWPTAVALRTFYLPDIRLYLLRRCGMPVMQIKVGADGAQHRTFSDLQADGHAVTVTWPEPFAAHVRIPAMWRLIGGTTTPEVAA